MQLSKLALAGLYYSACLFQVNLTWLCSSRFTCGSQIMAQTCQIKDVEIHKADRPHVLFNGMALGVVAVVAGDVVVVVVVVVVTVL